MRNRLVPPTLAFVLRSFKVMSTIAASIAPKLLELQTSNLVNVFLRGMPSRRTNNFPQMWAWPKSRDPYNVQNMIKHIFKTT